MSEEALQPTRCAGPARMMRVTAAVVLSLLLGTQADGEESSTDALKSLSVGACL
jgi:hypothetical protein